MDTLSSILISDISIPLHHEVLDKEAVRAIAAKWTVIAEKITERRSDYSNLYQELEISGLESRLHERQDIFPEKKNPRASRSGQIERPHETETVLSFASSFLLRHRLLRHDGASASSLQTKQDLSSRPNDC